MYTLHELRGLRTASGLPGGPVVKNLPANAGDMGSVPGLGLTRGSWSWGMTMGQVSPRTTATELCSTAHALQQE